MTGKGIQARGDLDARVAAACLCLQAAALVRPRVKVRCGAVLGTGRLRGLVEVRQGIL